MDTESIKELITRRRRQILVHSYLYYRRDTNIIDDHLYDAWGAELADLQRKYPKEADECVYADAFQDYDGSSGFDLPMGDPNVMTTAEQLLRYHKKRREAGLV